MATSACPHPKNGSAAFRAHEHSGFSVDQRTRCIFLCNNRKEGHTTRAGERHEPESRCGGKRTWDQHRQAQVAPQATAVHMQGTVWSPSGLLGTVGRACLVPNSGH